MALPADFAVVESECDYQHAVLWWNNADQTLQKGADHKIKKEGKCCTLMLYMNETLLLHIFVLYLILFSGHDPTSA